MPNNSKKNTKPKNQPKCDKFKKAMEYAAASQSRGPGLFSFPPGMGPTGPLAQLSNALGQAAVGYTLGCKCKK